MAVGGKERDMRSWRVCGWMTTGRVAEDAPVERQNVHWNRAQRKWEGGVNGISIHIGQEQREARPRVGLEERKQGWM